MANFADYYVIEILEKNIIALNLVKSYLRIDNEEENFIIEILIKSAIEYAENITGLSIRQKIIEAKFYQNRSDKFRLPKTPILSISEVSIIDKSANKKTLNKGDYKFDPEGVKLIIDEDKWGCLTIKYITGYQENALPSLMIEAILSHIAVMYDNRTGEISVPLRSLNTYYLYKKRQI